MPTPLPGLGGRQASRQVNRQAGRLPGQAKQLPQPAHHHSDLCRRCWQQHIQSIIHAHVPTVVPFSPLRCLIVLVFLNAEGLFQYTALDRFPPIHLTSSINGTKHITQRSPQKNVSTLCNLHSLTLSIPSVSPQTIHGLMMARIICGKSENKNVIISLRYLGGRQPGTDRTRTLTRSFARPRIRTDMEASISSPRSTTTITYLNCGTPPPTSEAQHV